MGDGGFPHQNAHALAREDREGAEGTAGTECVEGVSTSRGVVHVGVINENKGVGWDDSAFDLGGYFEMIIEEKLVVNYFPNTQISPIRIQHL